VFDARNGACETNPPHPTLPAPGGMSPNFQYAMRDGLFYKHGVVNAVRVHVIDQ